jgi:hypothetical protein
LAFTLRREIFVYASYPSVLTAIALLVPLSGSAHSAALESEPTAQVPLALEYRSAFAGYRPHREEEVADWRAVNDEVARIGGHVGILGGAGHGADAREGAAGSGAGGPPRRPAPDSGTHGTHH